MKKPNPDFLLILGLLVFSALYCHRFYGSGLPLSEAALGKVYQHLNDSLFAFQHNPFLGSYAFWDGFTDRYHPIVYLCSGITRFFLRDVDQVEIAVRTCFSIGLLTCFLFSAGIYSLGRYLTFSKETSFLAAIVLAFSGPFASGFETFYSGKQLAFLSIPLLIFLLFELHRTLFFRRYVPLIGLTTGVSFLSGEPQALAPVVGVCFFLPLLWPSLTWKARLRLLGYQGVSLLFALAVGTVTFLPWWRAGRDRFLPSSVGLLPKGSFDYLAQVFLSNWWFPSFVTGSSPYFLGAGIVSLLFIGLLSIKKFSLVTLKEKVVWRLLALGFLIGLIGSVKTGAQEWLILCFLPVSFFVGRGLENIGGPKSFVCVLIPLALQQTLIQLFLLRFYEATAPFTQRAATVSIIFSFITLVVLAIQARYRRRPTLIAGTLVSIFFTFYFAPTLGISTSDWPRFLGATDKYRNVSREAQKLLQPPEPFRHFETVQGKIIDFTTQGYFAPRSGHQFFARKEGNSSSVNEILDNRTEGILDLAGVCWLNPPLQLRPSCFAPYFLVGQILPLPSKVEVLQWMKNSSRNDFLSEMAVNCKETDCEKLQENAFTEQAANPLGDRNHLEPESLQAGSMRFLANSVKPQFLFLSTLYHPDWVVKINGKPGLVFKANHGFMAAPIPAGLSKVEFVLNTWALRWGLFFTWLSSFTLLAFGGAELTRFLPKIRFPKRAEGV